MSILKKNISQKTKRNIALIIFAIILLTAYVIWDVKNAGPLTTLFTDRKRLTEDVKNAGFFGPLAYIILQFLQTVIAPIPGGVISPLGGYLFGWMGVVWTSIGATLGALVVFWLAKRFGRGLVEKVVKKEAMEKFDFISGKRAAIILFILFLLPGLPDDTICYIGGLTKVPLKTLVVLFFIGRLPAVIGNNYIGMGLGEGNYLAVIISSILCVIILGFVYWKQDWILNSFRKNKKKPSKP